MEIKMSNSKARFLKIEADVRYWEDASINGQESEAGDNVPFKVGSTFCPTIDLNSGTVLDWPEGVVADFHFKVCDAGDYHLLDENKNIIASILNNYVPSGVCHGDNRHRDYIIFSVNGDGVIDNYKKSIDELEFDPV
jgi:hypothetical protein